ncbi:MAG: 4-alpha-glucanotransferase, partial [Butyrivibrio sp.]|nr:4-alpha-glucanotransferase [Butyrivibrio sp.]
MNRSCGILMPIFSLASRYGIGCLSKEAYDFVDFLAESGQSYWQILPVGPTGFGDSPYQPFSAFAGNPYFICLETLIEEELLTREECDSRDFGTDQERVDYGALYEHRFAVLRLAHGRFTEKAEKQPEDKDAVAFAAFRKREAWWLDDYALFSAIKEEQGGRAWIDWEDDKLRLHDETALKKAAKRLEEELDFIAFCQYEFDKQWH